MNVNGTNTFSHQIDDNLYRELAMSQVLPSVG
nr:MAG TPA: hypothetical protein [Caudoviricetes sp.]